MKIETTNLYVRGNEWKVDAGYGDVVTDRVEFRAKRTPANAEKIAAFIDALDAEFIVYQWRKRRSMQEYRDGEWRLFHWSNYNDGDLRECNAHISFNKNEQIAAREQLYKAVIERAREFFSDDASDEIVIYRVLVVEERADLIERTIAEHSGEIEKSAFVEFCGRVGRIKRIPSDDIEYGFFPKGNRTRYYSIGNANVLCLLNIAPAQA